MHARDGRECELTSVNGGFDTYAARTVTDLAKAMGRDTAVVAAVAALAGGSATTESGRWSRWRAALGYRVFHWRWKDLEKS